MNNESSKNFIRGGQTLLHNFRMFNQILNRVILFCLIIFILTTTFFSYVLTTHYQRYVLKELGRAELLLFFRNKEITQSFTLPDGRVWRIYSQNLKMSQIVFNVKQEVARALIESMILGGVLTLLALFLVYRWLKNKGKQQTDTKRIRGDEFGSVDAVNRVIENNSEYSDIKINNLFLPKNFEVRHTLIHGTQGSGKSVLIRTFLDQIQERGERVILYDKGYTFIPHYYRKNTDIIMNVLDERMPPWSLWEECEDFADFDSFAAGLIPYPKKGDVFWTDAARLIFSASARRMKSDKNRSMFKLLKTLLLTNEDEMKRLLKGTEAENYTEEEMKRTTLGVKAVLAIHLKYLKYIVEDKNAFSFKRWIRNDNEKNWIILSSCGNKHESLKPLISTWLDIIIKTLMSLPDDNNTRRIWLILDELPTLDALPGLLGAFAETRKFGGCLMIGLQNIAMLRKAYDDDEADAIIDLCKNKFYLNSPSYKIAKWVSDELGEEELEETKEGTSYSESAMRSGISISKQRYNRHVVSASEIMRMNDLQAYVRLPGEVPITKVQLAFKHRNEIAEPFVKRDIKERELDEVDILIEEAIKNCPLPHKQETESTELSW